MAGYLNRWLNLVRYNHQSDRGGAGRSVGSWSADPLGPGIWAFFDGNAAKGVLTVPYRENKPSYAERKVLVNVWIKKKIHFVGWIYQTKLDKIACFYIFIIHVDRGLKTP